jgi:hypothetical protein
MLRTIRALMFLACSSAASAQERIVTGTHLAPNDCSGIVHHPPGNLERIEGVYFSFIDWDGFVDCASVADCRSFLDRPHSEFAPSEAARLQLLDRGAAPWGTYRLVFMGRRGALTIPEHCDYQGRPEKPEYVTVEKVIRVVALKG